MQSIEERSDRISDSFGYLTTSMRYLGILYFKDELGCKSSRHTCSGIFSLSIHVFGLVFVWLNFARLFLAYDENETFNAQLMLKLIVHVTSLKIAVAFTTCSLISKQWSKIFKAWHSYRDSHCVTDAALTKTRRRVKIATVFVWMCHVAFGILLISTLLLDHDLTVMAIDIMLEPLPRYGFRLSRGVKILTCIVDIILPIGLTMTMLLIVCICLALRDEFEDFNHHFEIASRSHVDPESELLRCSDTLNIEYYRRWHYDAIKIVTLCDDSFSICSLLIFVADVPLICAHLYTSIYWESGVNLIVNALPFLFFLSIPLLLIIYAGTQLHASVSMTAFCNLFTIGFLLRPLGFNVGIHYTTLAPVTAQWLRDVVTLETER